MSEIKMLPLPTRLAASGLKSEIVNFAERMVEHNVAARDAEVEALRAERDLFRDETIELVRQNGEWQARAERLAEALRPFANLDLRPDGFDKRPDDQTIYARDRTAITVGDVRRARAALRDHDQEGRHDP